mmetsp:Transcript_19675/g.60632  ORF Transcript_19675/g.60632 Transcript_19675/m.60632 type:complete len:199 (+) Transcript_19675:365-961(+)
MSSQEPLPEDYKPKVASIVAAADKAEMTVKSVRRRLESDLGLAKGACDVYKDAIKAHVTALLDETTPAADEATPAADESPEAGPEAAPEDRRLAALKKLGTAVRFGPSLVRGLKDLTNDERVREMKKRFEAKGIEFHGAAPTAEEIKSHRARKQMEIDADGMDESNIISGKRRRIAAAPRAVAKALAPQDEDDEEEFV